MIIKELRTLTEKQVQDLLLLMQELNSELKVSAEMMRKVAASQHSHLFVLEKEDGSIVGTATLCVFESLLGLNANVEDVVVLSSHRGQHLGRKLMEHLIDYARRELKEVNLYLTSRPNRVVANEMYKALGFERRETNVYKLAIKGSKMIENNNL